MHVDADAPDDVVLRLGPAVALNLRPRLAGIGGLPEAAVGSAAVESPPRPPALVRRGVDVVRIHGIDDDVAEAGVGVDVLRFRPGLAAVSRLVEPALFVGPEEMSDRRHVDGVRIFRMNGHAADRLGVLEPQVRPAAAAITRHVDAVADRRALPVVRFAHADVDDARVARRDRDVTDGDVRHGVEHRRPRAPAVGRLPQPTGGEADPDGERIVDRALDVVHAPAHRRGPDRAKDKPAQHRIGRGVDGRPGVAGCVPPGACASAMAPARAHAEAIRIEPRTRKSSLVMAVFLSRLRSPILASFGEASCGRWRVADSP